MRGIPVLFSGLCLVHGKRARLDGVLSCTGSQAEQVSKSGCLHPDLLSPQALRMFDMVLDHRAKSLIDRIARNEKRFIKCLEHLDEAFMRSL
jgi:hypothetical protein